MGFIQLSGGATPRVAVEYTADENIAKGDFVGVTSAGKATTARVVPDVYSTALTELYDAATIGAQPRAVWTSGTKLVCIAENGGTLYSRCGTVNLATRAWTWGSWESLSITAEVGEDFGLCSPAADKIAIAYRDGTTEDGFAVVVSYSGTAVDTIGSPSEWWDACTLDGTDICSPDTDVIVVIGIDGGVIPKTRAVTISGTTIGSWGTVKDLGAAVAGATSCSCETLDTTHVGYIYSLAAQTMGTVASLSGAELTPGTPVEVKAIILEGESRPRVCAPSTGNIVFIYQENGGGVESKAGTWSGTTISNLGSETSLTAALNGYDAAVTSTDQILVVAADDGTGWRKIVLTRSGTNTLTETSDEEASSSEIDEEIGIATYEGNFFIVGYGDDADLYFNDGSLYHDKFYGLAAVDLVDIDGLLGIAESAIADTVGGTICVFGIPTESTKTGMTEEKGWYSTADTDAPLCYRDRDGDTGLYAVPVSSINLVIYPEKVGDNTWMA